MRFHSVSSAVKFYALATLLISSTILPLRSQAQTSNQSDVDQALNRRPKTSEDRGGLGFNFMDVTAAEAFLDYNKSPGQKGQFSTDGPTITLQAEVSRNLIPLAISQLGTVTNSTTLMFNEAARIDESKVVIPIVHGEIDWGHFIRESKFILDIDPHSGSPIATIVTRATVGIQDIKSGAFDSQMPIPDNGALRGITRERSARAIRIDLTSKILDSLALALFETGVYHPENYGDNPQPRSSGATVLMTKTFFESLKVSGTLTRINFPAGAEFRINTGIAYVNDQKGFTVFYNRVDFKRNPLYPDATSAYTLGVIKQIAPKHSLTLEATQVNDGRPRETALGYRYNISRRTSVGVGVRHTSEGNKYEFRGAYQY